MRKQKLSILFWSVLASLSCFSQIVRSFNEPLLRRRRLNFSRCMARGFNGAKNKQAELARKMGLAKEQRGPTTALPLDESTDNKLTKERQEFASLLAQRLPPPVDQSILRPQLRERSSARASADISVPSKQKKKKQTGQKRECQVKAEDLHTLPLHTGDIARRQEFEELVDTETNRPLGAMLAAQIVPWVPPFLKSCLIVFCDPRQQSHELRSCIQYLDSMNPDNLAAVAVISADTPNEILAWMKRQKINNSSVRILSDSKLSWMRKFSCVSDDSRWAISMLVFDQKGVISHVQHEVEPSHVVRLAAEKITTATPVLADVRLCC